MSDSLPRVQLSETALTDPEPWPQWREPPLEDTESLTTPGTAAASAVPAAVRSQRDDRADHLRAAGAQLSVILPFLGPLIAFGMSPATAPARRQAAKAFNGQATLALLMVTLFGVGHLGGANNGGEWLLFLGGAGLVGVWMLHVLIATIAAVCGRDWTSPLTRILRLQILPEDHDD